MLKEWIEERDGCRFLVSDDCDDILILDEIFRDNTYRVSAREGMTVLDIGACKGIFATWAARQGAKVTAYEANPKTYGALLWNARENGITVDARNLGVWSSHTKMQLHPNRANSGSSSFIQALTNENTGREVTVTMIPFDEAIGDKDWDVVKMDIEGSEFEILSTSKKLGQVAYLTAEIHIHNGFPGTELYERTILNIDKTHDIELEGAMMYAKRRKN